MLGKKILHYQIIEKLGEGGMGIVYLAEDTKLERHVAIKFLPSHISSNSDERKRFEIEAKAAAALNHPNIATIYAIEEADDQVFMAMEYIDGRELKNDINEGLPVEQVIDYGLQIAEGLQAAHNKNIIHRDIKSRNIMLTEEGKIKIMDFGLAKVRGGVDLTTEQSTLGTAAYMSPEQARGESVDPRSDIWSFGVVLYEMATGQLPFRGDYDQAVIYSILNEKQDDTRKRRADIPEYLERVIAKCLEKDVSDRYQDIKDLMDDIKTMTQESKTSVSSRSEQRKRLPVSFVMVLLIFAVLTLAYFFLSPYVTTTESQKIKLVVLPLENLGPADHDYFTDGMTEEITSRLAMINSLAVISRKTAMRYKDSEKSLKEIGSELGVDYVLEGTVRWASNPDGSERVRITPQLIQADEDMHLWTDNYERIIEDVFQVQADIAQHVAQQLGVRLLDREREDLNVTYTTNLDAYHAYLRGRYFMGRPHYTYENWQKGIDNFIQAVSFDSAYALAWSELARAHARLYFVREDLSQSRLNLAKEAAEKAIRLGIDIPEVHLNVGHYYLWALRDSEKALDEFLRAEREQPNNIELLKAKARMYVTLGKWPELITTLKKTLELNPRDSYAITELTFAYWFGHMYDQAMPACNRAIEIVPESPWPYMYKANIVWLTTGPNEISGAAMQTVPENHSFWWWMWYWEHVGQGNFERAFDLLARAKGDVLKNKIYARPKSLLAAWIHEYLGEQDRAAAAYDSARILLEDLVKAHPDDPRYFSSLGLTYAGQGRRADAIHHGKKAVELLPVSKDAVYGTLYAMDLAVTYAKTGDYDMAFDQLEFLLSVPSAVSVSWLKKDIRLTPLFKYKRFNDLRDKPTVDES
jgi:non-specific serine/threonine protein kinase